MVLKMQLMASEAHYLRARTALAAARDGVDSDAMQKIATEAGKALAALSLAHVEPLVNLVRGQKALLRGQLDRARPFFANAREQFETCHMRLYAAVAGRREGELTPGDQGRFLVERADRAMVELGIVRPDRMARLVAPVSAESQFGLRNPS